MAGKYYVEGEARAGRVEDLFARVAPRYDLINDLQSFGMHRWWKRRLVRLAAIRPGEKALDACCGTGDVSLALVRAGAVVTGLDFSEPMLAVARRRQADSGVPVHQLQFRQGDVLRLPFDDEAFDLVTISYGLRNLADCEAGLRELIRVLRPGGRLLVLDFGKPRWAPWRAAYFLYLRRVVPWFGRWFCGDADTHGYILDSLVKYPAQRGIDEVLRRRRGFETRVVDLLGGVMGINWARKPVH